MSHNVNVYYTTNILLCRSMAKLAHSYSKLVVFVFQISFLNLLHEIFIVSCGVFNDFLEFSSMHTPY